MDSDFESLDDLLSAPSVDAGVARKFIPKAKGRPKPRSSVVSSTLPKVNHVDSTTSAPETARENLVESNELSSMCDSNLIGGSDCLSNADKMQLGASKNQDGLVLTELPTVSRDFESLCDGSLNSEGLPLSGGDGCQKNSVEQQPNVEESASLTWNPFDDIDLGQPANTDGCFGAHFSHAAIDGRKFRPKLKSCPVKETLTLAKSGLSSDVKVNNGSDSNRQEKLNLINVSGNDDVPERSHEEAVLLDNDFQDTPSIFPAADDYFSLNEHPVYGSEIGQLSASLPEDDTHVETAHEIPAERVDDSVPAEGTGTKKPPRVPRKRKPRSTQASEAVEGENNGLQGELRGDSALVQDVGNSNNEGDNTRQKKGAKRSKKSTTDNVQQTRSRKKVNDTSGEQKEKPKKKFSHSTRGRRKQVDPTLLATPDDEIDHTSVSFKDLILRAEFLEHESKKAPTPSSKPVVEQRIESPPPFEDPVYYGGWNNFDSEQPEEYDDQNVEIHEASTYFNYHSFMKKTPRVAWSKVDTELFYQGIRQFGTDFTLIQQLFPGRTRNHIKSKYKKEERQHPQRITEAIENRAKGISHFEQVIEQLKAAEELENQELSNNMDGDEVNEDNIQDTNSELNDNSSERFEQDDVVAKDDAEAIDATDWQESEKMDEDYDEFVSNYVIL